jgi:DNA polymerase-3 subunit epsilon
MNLNIEKPLAVFDIESTGINRRVDRIIDLAIAVLKPDGTREDYAFRVNPGMPIPPGSTAVHGITDEDVKDAPSFQDVAADVLKVLEGCDLGGFNLIHFDIPVLQEEFARAGSTFDMEGRRVIDVQRIFHKKEPRDLSAALSFYCGQSHIDAHGAMADVEATIQVLNAQMTKYADLPRDVDALEEFCNPRNPEWVDRTGKLKWDGDEAVINFGKNQGRKLRDMAQMEKSFLDWMLRSDFPKDTLDIIRDALAGKFPVSPQED